MSDRKKPKLLIIGHGRHGKDTVAEMISKKIDLKFSSSSDFCGRKVIWPMWGQERYGTYWEMFEDRVNYRTLWGNMIEAYNTPDASRTASEMIAEGNDMYVGMRRIRELEACIEKKLFDYIIWVDACKRLPLEGPGSMELTREHAQLYIDNNGPFSNLEMSITNLQEKLWIEGFDVGMYAPPGHGERQTTKGEFQQSKDIQTKYPYCQACGLHHPEGKTKIFSCSEELQKIASESKTIPYTGVDTQPQLEDRLEWTDKPENAIQVLDHGFFEVKEVMGSDIEIAESARMSYGRGTKKVNNDEGLINYLVRNHHTSPLEMGEIRFHMRLPIFVMRQLVRHRTANLNEYSGRYSEMVRLFYVPEIEKIMYQGLVNKQMSGEPLPENQALAAQAMIQIASNASFDRYEELLAMDVSRETARIVLPLNTYTECVWKMDVSNLIKFLYLRDDDHAQWEIRVYARLIGEAVERFFPLVYAAYMRERESVKLTPAQITALIDGHHADHRENMSKSEYAQVESILLKY